VSVETIFFTHQVDQIFLNIHEAKNIFQTFIYKRFTSIKFKQIFIKTLQNERSLHTLIRITRTCIYAQYRVLL